MYDDHVYELDANWNFMHRQDIVTKYESALFYGDRFLLYAHPMYSVC